MAHGPLRPHLVLSFVRALGLLSIYLGLAGCTGRPPPEDPWRHCCFLRVVDPGPSATAADKTIIDWQRETIFTGTGDAGEPVETPRGQFKSWKRRQIDSGLADFQEHHPTARSQDYFRSLGMTCASPLDRSGEARCEIELSVVIECNSLLRGMIPGIFVPDLPEQVRGRSPAVLRMSVDVSVMGYAGSVTRIEPVPGGRLCHR